MGNCWFANEQMPAERQKTEKNMSSQEAKGSRDAKDGSLAGQNVQITEVKPHKKDQSKKELDSRVGMDFEGSRDTPLRDYESNGSRLQAVPNGNSKRNTDRIDDGGDGQSAAGGGGQDVDSVLRLEYVCGLKKDLLKRGTVVDIIEKAEVVLLDQLLGSKAEADDKQLAQVSRDDKGFMLSLMEEPCFRFRVGSICFFLDMNCQIDVGEIDRPEHSFQIVYLDFPKIRVNFNGFRVTTTEKNQNWSSYYVINERSQAKTGLHLERVQGKDETAAGGNNGSSGGQKEGQNVSGENSIMVLDQKQKEFFIGSDPNCTIKTSKGGTMGVIKYIEDIGWVVQANDPRIKDSKSSPLYGVFIRVKEPVRKLKLYEGMTFIMGQHMITAKELH